MTLKQMIYADFISVFHSFQRHQRPLLLYEIDAATVFVESRIVFRMT
jgi:hypothetical protein